MPSPKSLLPWLIGGAIGAGGIFQGLHWRSTAKTADAGDISGRLRGALEEIDRLKRENESLRSLAQGGGEMAVPQELVDLIEKEYGLKFLSVPVVHRIAAEELRDRISAAFESKFGPAGMDYRQEAYAQIGWISPEEKLLAQLTAVRAVGARAWFDDVTGEGWVTNQFQMENIPDQAALVRLIARILLHQNFPPSPAYPGDDAARAREALHQGAASGSEAKFYAANARAIGFMPLTENTQAEQVLATISPFVQGLTMFPVVEGKNYADVFRVAGVDSLQKVFRDPPQTTQEIFRPDIAKKPRVEIELPAVEGEPFFSDSAGELGLRLWLEPLGDVEISAEISSAWVNDRYVFFPESETASAVMWDIVLESREAADQLQATVLEMIAARAGKEAAAEPGVPVETLDRRFLVLSRMGPERVRFLNAAMRETAGRLGR